MAPWVLRKGCHRRAPGRRCSRSDPVLPTAPPAPPAAIAAARSGSSRRQDRPHIQPRWGRSASQLRHQCGSILAIDPVRKQHRSLPTLPRAKKGRDRDMSDASSKFALVVLRANQAACGPWAWRRAMRLYGALIASTLAIGRMGCGQGPQGAKGDPAPAGPPGAKGDAGPAGPAGPPESPLRFASYARTAIPRVARCNVVMMRFCSSPTVAVPGMRLPFRPSDTHRIAPATRRTIR
jgi:hypothetical protein